MKTKRIKSLAVAIALLMGISFTSCLNSNNESSWDFVQSVTIRSYMGSVYMLGDDGITYYPTNPDLLKISSTDGSPKYGERAFLTLKYVDEATNGATAGSRNVTIVGGRFISVKSFCDSPDTIKTTIPLVSLNAAGGVNGYITVNFNYNYTGSKVDFDLYPEKVEGDLLTLRFKQTYGKDSYGGTSSLELYSYRIPSFSILQSQLEDRSLGELTPVNDSIYVTIVGTGSNNTDLTLNSPYNKFRIKAE